MGQGEIWGTFLVGRGTPLMIVGGATRTGKGIASVWQVVVLGSARMRLVEEMGKCMW